jgi:Tfp pilus assembly protein PilV
MVEAVVSIAILFSSFLVIIALFHSGLRYTTRVQNQQLACMLAERAIEDMRSYGHGSTGSTYNFDNWAPYQNAVTIAPDYPGFQITTSVSSQTLYSGCSQIELGYPVTQQRSVAGSAVQARAQVSWDQGMHSLTVTSLIADAPRLSSVVRVTSAAAIPNPLPHDQIVAFSAQALDAAGNPIPGVIFSWDIAAGLGNGYLLQNRGGSVCNFTNGVSLANPLPPPANLTVYTSGTAIVEARARIHGVNVVGQSAPIVLQ